ncbi:MAG: outer membrane lipoprotein-sorting protein [Elusimicrobiota bacterium]
MLRKKCWALLFIFLFLPVLRAENPSAANINVRKIVEKIDRLYRSKTSISEIEMQIVTPNWERTLTMKAWTRGLNKTFIRILLPKKERNVATLRIDNEMWNYLPNANKIMKIPPSMMMSSWMGSDFTNDDLVKESSMLEDYLYRLIRPPDAQEGLLYVEFVPKEDKPIVWAKIIVAAGEADYIPVWQKYYDDKGVLKRVMEPKNLRQFSGRKIPSVLEVIPQNKPGHKTVIRYREMKFDAEISEDVFSLRNLQSKE